MVDWDGRYLPNIISNIAIIGLRVLRFLPPDVTQTGLINARPVAGCVRPPLGLGVDGRCPCTHKQPIIMAQSSYTV